MKKKTVFATPFSTLIVFSLFLAGCTGLSAAQTGLVTYLNSDTTWSTSSTLTGPVVVNAGVTLTVGNGVTVDLNGYYIYVNGTVKSLGTAEQTNFFYGGDFTFGASASGNSEFQYTTLNSTVTSTKTLIVNHCTLNRQATAGNQSAVTNTQANNLVSLGNQSTVTGCTLQNEVTVGDDCTIQNNHIYNVVTAGTNTKFSSNTVNYNVQTHGGMMGYSYPTAVEVGDNSQVTYNSIFGSVVAVNSYVAYNKITGGGPFTDWGGRSEDATSALQISGVSTVTQNVLWSTTGGYGLLVQTGYTTVANNIIKNSLRVAGDCLIENNLIQGKGIQVGDIYITAFNNIDWGEGNSVIRGNIIRDCTSGIWSSYDGGQTAITGNLILNCENAISLKSDVTEITGNTIQDSTVSLALNSPLSPLVNDNNFVNYTQNSILLQDNPQNVDAKNNYWGQTNVEAINLTVRDLKYDPNLGKVTIDFIRTQANPQAPSASFSLSLPPDASTLNPAPTPTPTPTPTTTETIPEFTFWATLTTVLAATTIAALYVVRRTLSKHPPPNSRQGLF